MVYLPAGDDGRKDDHVDETAGLSLLQQVLRHYAYLGEDDAEDESEDGIVDAGELAQPHAQQAAGHSQQYADVVAVEAVELLRELHALWPGLSGRLCLADTGGGGDVLLYAPLGLGIAVFGDDALRVLQAGV